MSCASRPRAAIPLVDMTPSRIDVAVIRGSRTPFEAVLTDGREPINISSDTVKFTVRDRYDGTLKIQKTNAPGSHYDPSNGRTLFTVLESDTVDADDARVEWVYEVRRVDVLGAEFVHITGTFTVEPMVGD